MVMPSKQTPQSHSADAQKAAALLRKEKKEPALSDAVRAAVEAMVFDGCIRREAAEIAGIKDDSLRRCLTKPDVLAYFNECQEVLRTSARPRALHKIIALSEKAGSERVALDASKYLDGMDRGAHQIGAQINVQVNNNVTTHVTPGYAIDLRPDERDQIGHLEQHDAKSLELQANVPDDE